MSWLFGGSSVSSAAEQGVGEWSFSRMRSEGFSFNSGGLEVGVALFLVFATIRGVFATVCRMLAVRSLSRAYGRCSKSVDAVREVDLLRFATCVEVAFAFRAASVIL